MKYLVVIDDKAASFSAFYKALELVQEPDWIILITKHKSTGAENVKFFARVLDKRGIKSLHFIEHGRTKELVSNKIKLLTIDKVVISPYSSKRRRLCDYVSNNLKVNVITVKEFPMVDESLIPKPPVVEASRKGSSLLQSKSSSSIPDHVVLSKSSPSTRDQLPKSKSQESVLSHSWAPVMKHPFCDSPTLVSTPTSSSSSSSSSSSAHIGGSALEPIHHKPSHLHPIIQPPSALTTLFRRSTHTPSIASPSTRDPVDSDNYRQKTPSPTSRHGGHGPSKAPTPAPSPATAKAPLKSVMKRPNQMNSIGSSSSSSPQSPSVMRTGTGRKRTVTFAPQQTLIMDSVLEYPSILITVDWQADHHQ
ncbi:hypothetical protein SAMD00019534_042510 [Acytostelium subglobosum LB1]|uniref:hypothetical protein n=1 Tax=Acytostelium subglobosum LB1 TaxID=1410327 RepID=UPI000644DFE1|nr:hypothetical protein SAMD00019534_042510 [Acytostelium subglobosum LB1]GAM21076.1 hypothetical protein SAMD00019534_042510 [Acytostelium subglobosum LB1]|eukprot:XP_012756210.1 hypothetical protein SAMD00019534_042510 [Acytostelium subglobosum LB1]